MITLPFSFRRRLFALAALAALAASAPDAPVVQIALRKLDRGEAATVSFSGQIKPILLNNCIECHSSEDHKGGLDVTSVATLLKGGKKAGPAIIAGKPDESPL